MTSSLSSSSNGSPKADMQRQQKFYRARRSQRSLYGFDHRFSDFSVKDASEDEPNPDFPLTTSNLNKWTNMLHGWQERYFVLKNGVLSYYRSADAVDEGCRGSIRLANAQVLPHPYDDCRIDVSLGDSTWYFRCPSAQSRRHWVDCIEKHRLADSGYSSEQALTTQGSSLSLNSIPSISNLSGSDGLCGRNLLDKVAEIESFKLVLGKQAEKLQTYLEICHRVSMLAEESGGYDHLLDSAIFEDTISLLRQKLTALRTSLPPYSSLEPGAKFVGLNEDVDDMDSLNSDIDPDEAIFFTSSTGHIPDEGDDCAAAIHYDASDSSLRDTSHTTSTLASLDSGDEGTKTPKASNSLRNGGGFFSRFLPFRGNTNNGANSSSSATNATDINENPPKCSSCSNKNKSISAVSLHTSRMHDLNILLNQFGAMSIDFGTEVELFKSTCSALQVGLSQTIEIFNRREDTWHRRLERETNHRRALERQLKTAQETVSATRINASLLSRCGLRMGPGQAHQRSHSHGGQQGLQVGLAPPTIVIGTPYNGSDFVDAEAHSAIASGKIFFGNEVDAEFPKSTFEYDVCEENFYDAIDAQIDKMHQDEACLIALKSMSAKLRSADAMPSSHPLYAEVSKVCKDRMNILLGGFPSADGEVKNGWTILAKRGDMTIYNREVESADGTYLDPLQAVHKVYNVTAREMCEVFWDVQHRLDWEITIDQAPTIVEVCGDDTVLLYQPYKRIWPATQRDSCFWSHIRRLDSTLFPLEEEVAAAGFHLLDTWMVVNYSTRFGDERLPPSSHTPAFIRLEVDVEMFCQTLWQPPTVDFDVSTLPDSLQLQSLSPEEQGERWEAAGVKREDLQCRLLYASEINPGGWAPAVVVRAMARREYPHFLQRISDFVLGFTADKAPKF